MAGMRYLCQINNVTGMMAGMSCLRQINNVTGMILYVCVVQHDRMIYKLFQMVNVAGRTC